MSSENSAWISFEAGPGSFLSMPVSVNGENVIACLDTGASRTVLDRAFAQQLRISTEPALNVAGLTSRIVGSLTDELSVVIAERAIGLKAAVLDLSGLEVVARQPIKMILGLDLFEECLVEIDFAKARIRLLPSGVVHSHWGEPTPLCRSSDRLFTIELQVPRGPPVSAALDLGSNVPLYFSPGYAGSARILDGLPKSTAACAGAEGVGVSRIAVLPRIELGGASIRGVPVRVPSEWAFESDAVVGLPLLRRFRLALDTSNCRAWLIPDKRALESPFSKDRSGIGALFAGDRLRIVHVAANSPAEKLQLRPGQEVVSIDGQPINSSFRSSDRRVGDQPAGTEILLGFADGKTRRLVLEDYF